MLRTIILLSPIFVTLFWSITLIGNKKIHSTPRLFLSKFMLFPFVCFVVHFAYFAPLPHLYFYLDLPYQYAGSLALPMFYIYFRLLTVDEKFSFKTHSRYLVIPFAIATLYCIGAILTPTIEYTTWLFDETAYPDSPYIRFLMVMRSIQRIQFLVLVVLAVIGNRLLLKKYGSRAEQFYSDITDGKLVNANLLNYSLLLLLGASFVEVALGRRMLMPKDLILYTVWSISTVMLYIIGYMGFKQKTINPTFSDENSTTDMEQLQILTKAAQNTILLKILMTFEEKKIYLRSNLNIMDIVQEVGTNRSYVSAIINQQYHQNFCSFVNSYRIEELERIVNERPDSTNENLAECCGFGSVISLRRAINAKTGLSLADWKKQVMGTKL